MNDLTIFERAIAAHAKWTYRLMEVAESGSGKWSVAEVRADDRCEFGCWLEQLPARKRYSDQCSHITSLHTEFHSIAAEILALALLGEKEEAKAAMALGSRFKQVSGELTSALSAWAESEKA
jgi:hypothetical protein